MSSDEARARRSLVAPVQNPAQGDTLVVIDRTHWFGGNGREEESRPHALLVLATNGRWQPAKSLFEYVQQNVIETCASTIEDEEWRNERLCEVHVEVHGLWDKGVSRDGIYQKIAAALKPFVGWDPNSVSANEDMSLVVVGFASEDAADKACACQGPGKDRRHHHPYVAGPVGVCVPRTSSPAPTGTTTIAAKPLGRVRRQRPGHAALSA